MFKNCYSDIWRKTVPHNQVMYVNLWAIFFQAKRIDWSPPPNTAIFHKKMKNRGPVSYRGNPEKNYWKFLFMAIYLVSEKISSHQAVDGRYVCVKFWHS